jgi:hypothetical protein
MLKRVYYDMMILPLLALLLLWNCGDNNSCYPRSQGIDTRVSRSTAIHHISRQADLKKPSPAQLSNRIRPKAFDGDHAWYLPCHFAVSPVYFITTQKYFRDVHPLLFTHYFFRKNLRSPPATGHSATVA